MTVDVGMTLTQALHSAFRDHASQVALDTGDSQFTYGDLLKRARRHTVSQLALALPNGPELIVSILAAALREATLAPLNIRQPPAQLARQSAQLQSAPRHGGLYLFTSGSRGTPKAAALTWDNLFYSALGSQQSIPLTPGNRWLLSLPLYHVGGIGILIRCWLNGATVVLPRSGIKPLDATLRRHSVSHASVVPTQLCRLLGSDCRLPELKTLLVGGAPCPASFLHTSLPIIRTYGLTEMASQVTTTSHTDRYSSGTALPHVELSIDAHGEIHVDGPSLFKGYLIEDVIEEQEGPFATGDLGYLDQDRQLHVTGRKDNLIISGGENIQPEEVEAALLSLPNVERACVVPIADPEFGQRPIAYIQGSLTNLEPLEEQLPKYKRPVAYHPWPDDLLDALKPPRKVLEARAKDK